ncbi:MAG: TonB-dependent receptor plug domain-containing protein, partial [Segetibacter sp.]
MRKLLLLLMLPFIGLFALAQETRVTGKVTNAAGEPVAGASVVVKGQRKGVATNTGGEFTISVPKGATLVITSIGFAPEEIRANGTNLSATLKSDNNQLSDVVVVGYGTQRRANITGSVVTLKNDVLTRRQVASTSNLLQGLAPGVSVQQQSGKPGGDAASISIRGISSISAGTGPLIIIDGVVSTLDNIDPNAIESISVLKDAASTAIYGSRASNGVILVRTKRATGIGLKVSYNNFISKQVATAIPQRTTAIEHMELSNIAEQNRTGNPASFLYPTSLIDKYKT